MIRANIYDFFELGAAIEALKAAQKKEKDNTLDFFDIYLPLNIASMKIKSLSENSEFLTVTKHSINKLRSSLSEAMGACFEQDDEGKRKIRERIPSWEVSTVFQRVEEFEHVFAADCVEAASYVAPKKGIFNTKDLMENALAQFPNSILSRVPGHAQSDYQNAGKCLALNLQNACGFHALRAVESTLKIYLEFFSDRSAVDKCKSWGDYVKKLTSICESKAKTMEGKPRPSKKTIRNIDQMRDLDRNPIMHPEDNLSETEAFMLFHNATTAIASMCKELLDLEAEVTSSSELEGQKADVRPATSN